MGVRLGTQGANPPDIEGDEFAWVQNFTCSMTKTLCYITMVFAM